MCIHRIPVEIYQCYINKPCSWSYLPLYLNLIKCNFFFVVWISNFLSCLHAQNSFCYREKETKNLYPPHCYNWTKYFLKVWRWLVYISVRHRLFISCVNIYDLKIFICFSSTYKFLLYWELVQLLFWQVNMGLHPWKIILWLHDYCTIILQRVIKCLLLIEYGLKWMVYHVPFF